MATVTLEEARRAAKAAIEKAKALNIRISVAVVDPGGRIVLLKRQDGGIWAPNWGCQAKARGAAALGGIPVDANDPNNAHFVQAIRESAGGHFVFPSPSGGGVPVIRKGVLVGAVGVGGGTGSEDRDCAVAGEAAI